MTLIRWEPARELGTIQTEMNRLFNTFFDAPSAGHAQPPRRWIPAMDLVETESDFVLRADLPGIAEEDVNIELEDSVLTIAGERKSDQEERGEGMYRLERAWGSFSRTLTLPEGVDPDGVRAHFDRGVLEIRIAKPQAPTPRKVAISIAGQPRGAAEQPETIEGEETANGTAPEPAGSAA